MEFRLYYKGPLKANGDVRHKHEIRESFHSQLAKLWEYEPLVSCSKGTNNFLMQNPPAGLTTVIYTCKGSNFACLVNERLKLYAELDILFLRNEPPGQLIGSGGDIDNRLKTLFDALRRPISDQEIPPNYDLNKYNPFHCLLSDDGLITKVNVTTDQLLIPEANNDVVLIVAVRVRATSSTWDNIDFGS